MPDSRNDEWHRQRIDEVVRHLAKGWQGFVLLLEKEAGVHVLSPDIITMLEDAQRRMNLIIGFQREAKERMKGKSAELFPP